MTNKSRQFRMADIRAAIRVFLDLKALCDTDDARAEEHITTSLEILDKLKAYGESNDQ